MYLWFRVTYRDTGSASTYPVTASSLSQGIEQRRSCYLRRSISLNGEDFPVKVLTIPFSPRNVLKNHGVLIQVFAFKIRLFDFVRRDNSDICREMMCHYLDRIIAIAETHGSENCIVWSNGDAISGNIHQSIAITNKENVIEQIKGVSELIAEFVAELSKHFSTVTFVSVAGNHSRITPNKDDALLSERLDDIVEWYLGARLQNFENVIIGTTSDAVKIDNTMYLINIRGKMYCGVHGDFDGSAGKVQTLQTMARVPLYAVLSGHLHHNKIDEVQGVKTVMAGSFLGMDDYCVQKRIFGKAEQLVCVCDTNGIRCSYGVPL